MEGEVQNKELEAEMTRVNNELHGRPEMPQEVDDDGDYDSSHKTSHMGEKEKY